MSAYLPLFDQGEFFALILSTRTWPLPSWAESRTHINFIFAQLHSELLFRVNQYIYFTFPFQPTLLTQFNGEPSLHFERHKQSFFLAYFLDVCGNLEATIESMRVQGGAMAHQGLLPLIVEVTRLRSVLNAIAYIVHPLSTPVVQAPPPVRLGSLTYEDNIQPLNQQKPEVVQPTQAKPLVRLVSITDCEEEKKSRTQNKSSKPKKEFSREKVLLELKKDRVKSNSVSSSGISSSSGRSTRSSESEVESQPEWADYEFKKNEDFEDFVSTDEEDFDAYTEEILKLTTTNVCLPSSSSSSSSGSSSSSPSIASEEDRMTEIIKDMQIGIAKEVFSFLGEFTY